MKLQWIVVNIHNNKALHGAVMHLSFVIKIYLKIRKGYYTKKGYCFATTVFIVFIKSKNSVKKCFDAVIV